MNYLITSYLCDSEIVRFAQKRQFQMYADFYLCVTLHGCGYPTVDINYANYIFAISVLLA